MKPAFKYWLVELPLCLLIGLTAALAFFLAT